MRRPRLSPATAAFAVVGGLAGLVVPSGPAAAAGAEDPSFMPRGGRTLLVERLGASPRADEMRRLLGTTRSEPEWAAWVAAGPAPASERERATLVAYLATHLPLPAAATSSRSAEDLLAALPRDGRDLAWQQCQFCHSLFTSHLTQRRDEQGWRNMFLSPFHRELKMTAREREEFARYSAINMPMRIEDVPEELRF